MIITRRLQRVPARGRGRARARPRGGGGGRRRPARRRVGRAGRRLRGRRARRRGRRVPRSTGAASRRSPATSGRRSTCVVAELPRNAAGKVLKRRLRESGGGGRCPSVELLDATLRDGQQSLWGMRMQAGMALPVADPLDRTGFRSSTRAAARSWRCSSSTAARTPGRGSTCCAPRSTARRCAAGCAATPRISFGVSPGRADGPLDAPPERARRALLLDLRRALRRSTTSPGWRGSPRSTAPRSSARSSTPSRPSTPTSTWPARRPRSRPCPRSTASSSTTRPACSTSSRLRELVPKIVAAAAPKPVEIHANNLMGTSGLTYVEAVRHGIHVLHTATRSMANGPVDPVDRERRAQPRADGLHALASTPRCCRRSRSTSGASAGRRATWSTRSASTTCST